MTEQEKQNQENQEEQNQAQEEAKTEETKQEEEKQENTENSDANDTSAEEVEVPEQFKDIVEKIEQMTVLELNELVKVLEKKFGVSAVAVAAAGAAGGAASGGEEKTEFDVVLAGIGDQKIAVIKAIKEILGLGLKEAKEFVESAPKPVKEGVAKEEAEEIKKKLEEAGASVELK